MDFLGFILMLCIGNTAGWLIAIYVKDGDLHLLENITIATIGSFVGGLSFAALFPVTGGIGAGMGAIPGAAIFLLAAYRLRRARSR